MTDTDILKDTLKNINISTIDSLCYIEYGGQFVKVPKVINVAPILNPVEGSAERNAEADLTTYEVARVPDLELSIGSTTYAEMNLILNMVKKKPFRVKWYNLESGEYYINEYYCPGIRYSHRATKDGCSEFTFQVIAYRDVERGRLYE